MPAKRQEDGCIGRYLEGLKNQNGEHLINLCELKKVETQAIISIVN